jgi:hypothetical protein
MGSGATEETGFYRGRDATTAFLVRFPLSTAVDARDFAARPACGNKYFCSGCVTGAGPTRFSLRGSGPGACARAGGGSTPRVGPSEEWPLKSRGESRRSLLTSSPRDPPRLGSLRQMCAPRRHGAAAGRTSLALDTRDLVSVPAPCARTTPPAVGSTAPARSSSRSSNPPPRVMTSVREKRTVGRSARVTSTPAAGVSEDPRRTGVPSVHGLGGAPPGRRFNLHPSWRVGAARSGTRQPAVCAARGSLCGEARRRRLEQAGGEPPIWIADRIPSSGDAGQEPHWVLSTWPPREARTRR